MLMSTFDTCPPYLRAYEKGHYIGQWVKDMFITLDKRSALSNSRNLLPTRNHVFLIPSPPIPQSSPIRRKARLTGLRGRSRHDLLMLRLRPRRPPPPPPPPPPRRGGERLSRRLRLSPRRGMATRWGATRRVGPGVVALLGQKQRAKQF